jgi:DNA (cytosine-5)-methyltransferase 1
VLIEQIDPLISTKQRATKRAPLRVASLFSGIAGFEVGLRRSSHRVLYFCDSDPAARAVLNHRFPGVRIHEDVRDLETLPEEPDLVTAGFPCADLSQAGRTAGIFGEQSGLIWQIFRLLDRRPVRWVLLENVPFMLTLARGGAIAAIADAFELRGYRWAYRILDPRTFGLPQRRPRVFLLASQTESPSDVLFGDCPVPRGRNNLADQSSRKSYGFYWTEGNTGIGWAVNSVPALKGGSALGIPSPPAIILPDRRIVTPNIADAERLQGFPAHWTAPGALAGRIGHRWRLIGNSVNVRVAEWIGAKLISSQSYEDSEKRQIDVRRWPTSAYGEAGQRFQGPEPQVSIEQCFCPLNSFLRFSSRPLSQKASSGVLGRLKTSSLNVPDILLAALEAHLVGSR